MSFKIDSGLFKFNFTDHHAVLGVPVDAEFKDIRKRYLKIARCLHPDSCSAQSEDDRQLANQLLSKLVNPAYEKFPQARNRAEYTVVLNQIGKRLVQESASLELKSELSKQLAQTNGLDHGYKTSLGKLAENQYDSFDQVLQLIAQISELNLVYLMRKGGKGIQSPPPPKGAGNDSGKPKQDTPPSPLSREPESESIVEQYYRRAQVLIVKNNFAQARVELQDALKLEPKSSRCHSLMGVVYLKQNQTTMAKVFIKKALQLNPQDPMALKGKQFLEQQTTSLPKPIEGTSDKSSGGGMFAGLFGGKKK